MSDTILDLGLERTDEARAGAGAEPRQAARRSPLQGLTIDRVLLGAALVMLPGGAAAILLGWYGAARTPYLFEQVPYLISGGLLGIGLLLAGGLLYIGSWLSRLAQQQRAEAAQLRELLLGLHDSGATAGSRTAGAGGADALVATATGTMFHRPDCPVVAGKEGLRTVSASQNGLRPCKLCDPLPTPVSP